MYGSSPAQSVDGNLEACGAGPQVILPELAPTSQQSWSDWGQNCPIQEKVPIRDLELCPGCHWLARDKHKLGGNVLIRSKPRHLTGDLTSPPSRRPHSSHCCVSGVDLLTDLSWSVVVSGVWTSAGLLLCQ